MRALFRYITLNRPKEYFDVFFAEDMYFHLNIQEIMEQSEKHCYFVLFLFIKRRT